MALEFVYRGVASPGRVALFPGAWNPPTIAHVAIARLAAEWADEVIWVLPRAFPHKSFDSAGFNDRRAMLEKIARAEPAFSAAVSDGGLYSEIADEARAFYGSQGSEPEIALACGADAAERIASWNYDVPDAFQAMIQQYPLLVAARGNEYRPAMEDEGRIIRLTLEAGFQAVSSTDVRRRIAGAQPWKHLVPGIIADKVQELYGID